jgi:hypothetical protein
MHDELVKSVKGTPLKFQKGYRPRRANWAEEISTAKLNLQARSGMTLCATRGNFSRSKQQMFAIRFLTRRGGALQLTCETCTRLSVSMVAQPNSCWSLHARSLRRSRPSRLPAVQQNRYRWRRRSFTNSAPISVESFSGCKRPALRKGRSRQLGVPLGWAVTENDAVDDHLDQAETSLCSPRRMACNVTNDTRLFISYLTPHPWPGLSTFWNGLVGGLCECHWRCSVCCSRAAKNRYKASVYFVKNVHVAVDSRRSKSPS